MEYLHEIARILARFMRCAIANQEGMPCVPKIIARSCKKTG
jgi:hypothetical protein